MCAISSDHFSSFAAETKLSWFPASARLRCVLSWSAGLGQGRVLLAVHPCTFSDKVVKIVRRLLTGGRSGDTKR